MAQIDRCFGFDTAVEEAQRALLAAKVEASSAFKGIGLVKLMGRQSGFIAMQASMASGVVDVCLIPEVCSVVPCCHAASHQAACIMATILFGISLVFRGVLNAASGSGSLWGPRSCRCM